MSAAPLADVEKDIEKGDVEKEEATSSADSSDDKKIPEKDVKIDITVTDFDEKPEHEIIIGGRKFVVLPVRDRKLSVPSQLEDISEDEAVSTHDRSRKSSHAAEPMHYIPLPHAYPRKMSTDPFILNPRRYSFDPLRNDYRKVSIPDIHMHRPSVAAVRKASFEPLYLPGVGPKYSVISVGSEWDQQDTFEALPHPDHYSRDLFIAVDANEFKKRPTIEELRSEDSVSKNTQVE